MLEICTIESGVYIYIYMHIYVHVYRERTPCSKQTNTTKTTSGGGAHLHLPRRVLARGRRALHVAPRVLVEAAARWFPMIMPDLYTCRLCQFK